MKVDNDYKKISAQIEANSKYSRNKSVPKKMMTVHEMGDILGIKKTERYWLLKKNCFKTKIVFGKTMVDIESFEKWYANQIKYKKIDGEEPGKELKEWSLSISDIGNMLNLSGGEVYNLLKRENIETVVVDYWKRVPKKAFFEWYENQTRYRTGADRKQDAIIESVTITMPEMAELLNISRQQVYKILKNEKYKDYFEYVVIAENKRITKKSFYKFLESQNEYHLSDKNDCKSISMEKNESLAKYRRLTVLKNNNQKCIGNQKYLTRKEAAILAGVSPNTISVWYEKEFFPAKRIGSELRICRQEFEWWLNQNHEKEE